MSFRRNFLPALIASSLILNGILSLPPSVSGRSNSGNAQPVIAAAPSPSTIYLPLVSNTYPNPIETVFGVEMARITTDGRLDQVVAANTTWVRRNGVLWADIEPNEGTRRDWRILAGLEQELRDARANNLQVILIVRKTPGWAQKVIGSSCGPIKPEKLGAFGNFMHDLVSRYSRAPYNVRYWEIWNEPDVDPVLADVVGGDGIPFGCWGDSADPYYGGEYYAEMLKTVYPRIKAADPQAQVLVGGLLLDCDPRGSPSFCTLMGHDDRPPRFLEGILRNNGGAYFDGVGFHSYDYYNASLGQYTSRNWNSSWNTTGSASIAKTRFIKEVLAAYNVSNKFIMNSEMAIVCGGFNDPPGQSPCESEPTSAFEQTKAYYVAQVYAAAIAEGLRANIWFSVSGWRNSTLLRPDLTQSQIIFASEFAPAAQNSGLLAISGTPRPAYYAYRFARLELAGVLFVGEIVSADIGGVSGVKGYKFKQGNRTIWLLWSLDGARHIISFSTLPSAIFDTFGNSLSISSPLTVTLRPVYIEW